MNVGERRIERETGGNQVAQCEKEREREKQLVEKEKKNTSMKSFLSVSHEALSPSNSYST